MKEDFNTRIRKKYEDLGENPDTYLEGMVHTKPLNYWDYIEVDTLLSLQKPRTVFKDEEIFILYHQVTELMLKLMIHELKQVVETQQINEGFLVEKLKRLCRYTGMLINSFDIMKDGMNYEDYNTFRHSLAPASGFQSAQFRYLEIYCTPIINLVNEEGKKSLSKNPSTSDLFEVIYWKAAGTNKETGKKSLTLKSFEDKYLKSFIALADDMKGITLEEKFQRIQNPSEQLTEQMREFDHLYNVAWPMVHLNTARSYLDKKGENKAATGGSAWKKYLHPKHQQRKFFPRLWTEIEMNDWGNENNSK